MYFYISCNFRCVKQPPLVDGSNERFHRANAMLDTIFVYNYYFMIVSANVLL